jgi:peroxiredoxin
MTRTLLKPIVVAVLGAALVSAAEPVRRAPGFCLIDTTGQWHDLADYRGKIVVLEFMQTTCPHCAALVPVLTGLREKYGDRVAVLSMAISPDTPQAMAQFATGHKLSYPLMFDMGQVAVSYVRANSINFPTIYLIDSNGMIRDHWEYTPLTKDVFESGGLARAIDRLLAGAPATGKK